MKYDKNEKLFNIYVFFTTFSRNLIEVFIGTILFKAGFTFHEVVLYFVIGYAFSTVLAAPCIAFSKRFSNKILAFVGVIAFIALQIILNHPVVSIPYLFLVGFVFALYRKAYWVSRRYYTLKLISHQKNVARKYSVMSVINQLGVIVSSYAGSVFLEFFSIEIITMISFALLTLSTFILHFIKFKAEEPSKIKLQPFKAMQKTPASSMLHIIFYELGNIGKCLFPLYLVMYVKNTYTMIGFVGLFANIAALVFIYMYGRLINKKRNFLKLSLLLYIVMKVLQVNTEGIALMIISFFEGFVLKLYEQSFHKDYLILSRKFDPYNFNLLYELVMDIGRLAVIVFLFLCFDDPKTMIYVNFAIMSLGLLFKFKTTTRKTANR